MGTTTKNAKIRKIYIPQQLNDNLIKLKNTENIKPYFQETWFVFGNEKHITYNPLRNKFLKYYNLAKQNNSNLQLIRIHDFRHSHVSWLINTSSNNLSILYTIAERIGDTVEQVMKTYGHLFPNAQKELIDNLDNLE